MMAAIQVFMTAAPRDTETQRRAIQSVQDAGFPSLTILAEPGTEIAHDFPRVIQHTERQGQWRNLVAALREGVRSGAGCFLTMEDDVILHRQTAQLLAASEWPDDCGCLQLYTAERLRLRYRRGGRSKLRKQDQLDLLGCCALLFSRAAAEVLVQFADEHGWRGDTGGLIEDPSKKKAGDTFIGEVLTDSRYDVWIHNPSLADHIGDVSTMGHHEKVTPNRRPLDFPGQQTDIFTIFKSCSDMKIAAIYKTFDGGEFVDASLASIYENVDSIVMVHSDVSWLGEHGNTVRPAAIKWCEEHDEAGKVIHLDVSLTSQEEQYRAGLDYLARHKIPYDLVMAVDADEIWEDQYFERARQQIADRPGIAYRCNMHTYLKTPFFRVHPPYGLPTVFFRDPGQLLKSPRGCRAPAINLDNTWMHHFTYVRETRDAVERKLRQSCLADGNEMIIPGWMSDVYDRLPFGRHLHAFIQWRESWECIHKIWWSDLPPAMREAKLLSLWFPPGLVNHGEMCALYDLAQGRKQAVDLGTYTGLSAVVLALACERVHTVDAYEAILNMNPASMDGDYEQLFASTGQSLASTQRLCDRYGNMTCEQADTAQAAATWTRGPVDVIFVDADHSRTGTLANVRAWSPHMPPGSRAIFHDHNPLHAGVMESVAELLAGGGYRALDCGRDFGSIAALEVVR